MIDALEWQHAIATAGLVITAFEIKAAVARRGDVWRPLALHVTLLDATAAPLRVRVIRRDPAAVDSYELQVDGITALEYGVSARAVIAGLTAIARAAVQGRVLDWADRERADHLRQLAHGAQP